MLVDAAILVRLSAAQGGRIGKLHGYPPTRIARLDQLEQEAVASEFPVGDHLSDLLDQVVGDPVLCGDATRIDEVVTRTVRSVPSSPSPPS